MESKEHSPMESDFKAADTTYYAWDHVHSAPLPTPVFEVEKETKVVPQVEHAHHIVAHPDGTTSSAKPNEKAGRRS